MRKECEICRSEYTSEVCNICNGDTNFRPDLENAQKFGDVLRSNGFQFAVLIPTWEVR